MFPVAVPNGFATSFAEIIKIFYAMTGYIKKNRPGI